MKIKKAMHNPYKDTDIKLPILVKVNKSPKPFLGGRCPGAHIGADEGHNRRRRWKMELFVTAT
jgi:hypothetical protein